jgi:hypothetical protein
MRLRKLATPQSTCDEVVNGLGAAARLRPPRRHPAPSEVDFFDAIYDWHVTSTRVFEGADEHSRLVAGLRDRQVWRYQVVRFPESTP